MSGYRKRKMKRFCLPVQIRKMGRIGYMAPEFHPV